ncbi:Protein SlyX [Maioricimonas rarisocia]|uniref:Protein SlyX n=1 Tax=Maioricimonas rarisocia TaxID=2528026 RepID=A0A517ZCH4_9PLAN|nr:SlyX family protein [Maioricimonas rarisocia]QDU40159.1 Protein SlyX [Maioricimonas rarisocia]
MSDPHPLEDRLARIETLIMHMQHDMEQFNSVLIEQQKHLEQIRERLTRIEDEDEDWPDDPRDPGLEKPPHY